MTSVLSWLLCLCICLSSTSSCSYIATKRVPGNYKSDEPLECTGSLNYAFADMALTALSGAIAIALLSSGRDGERTQQAAGFTTLGLSLGAGSSAIYGTYQVNRCRRKKSEEGLVGPESVPEFDRAADGELGGKCLPDGQCSDELVCDPMGTCVPEPDPFEDDDTSGDN